MHIYIQAHIVICGEGREAQTSSFIEASIYRGLYL